jgi:hypothetical protein
MDIGEIAEIVANIGEHLMKHPEIVLIIVLLIMKIANVW